MNLETEVLSTIQTYQMIPPGGRILVGISGGADSVCLLAILKELCDKGRLQAGLRAVHVHHGLRAAADEDLDFVRGLCGRLSVPLSVHHVDVTERAGICRRSLEEAGRDLRREIFAAESASWDAEAERARGRESSRDSGTAGCRVALAHHMEDNAETLLFRLCRGSSLAGLSGILPVSSLGGECTGRIIRPLLFSTRTQIEEWLEGHGYTYRTDETNTDIRYARNYLRHEVFPGLEEHVNSSAVRHMAATASEIAGAQEYLCRQTDLELQSVRKPDGSSCSVSAICELPAFMRKRVLYRLIAEAADSERDIGSAHVEALDRLLNSDGTASVDLPHGLTVWKEYDTLCFHRNITEVRVPLSESEYRIRILSFDGDTAGIPAGPYTKWFDYDKISSPLLFRTRRVGDRIAISGAPDGALRDKKVAREMIDGKIPAGLRDRMVLPMDGAYALWIPGFRMSAAYRVGSGTRRILEITWKRDKAVGQEGRGGMEKVTEMIPQGEVEKRIRELAAQISADYAGREIRMVGILKGASFFMCELAKSITVPVSIDFMQISSYGSATESTGTVKIRKDLDEEIDGLDVIIVEDIIDSGRSLAFLRNLLECKGAHSIRYCTLLDKPERRVVDLKADYVGFTIPDRFVVGYGMDYDQRYRNLPYIGVVELG